VQRDAESNESDTSGLGSREYVKIDISSRSVDYQAKDDKRPSRTKNRCQRYGSIFSIVNE